MAEHGLVLNYLNDGRVNIIKNRYSAVTGKVSVKELRLIRKKHPQRSELIIYETKMVSKTFKEIPR